MIRLDNYTLKYADSIIVENVNLQIDDKDFMAIFGASGIGKSSILNSIIGYNKPSGGEVLVDDTKVYEVTEKKRFVMRRDFFSFVAQETNLIQSISIMDNVMLPMRMKKVECTHNIKEKAEYYLQLLGLEKKINSRINTLSGGEKRRVEIARALCNAGRYLLIDEPTENLDAHTADTVADALKEYHREHGCVVICTHDGRFANMATRVMHIEGKQVVEN